jgi:hypothetical protein
MSSPTEPTGREILAVPLHLAAQEDSGAATVREYLVALLRRLWEEEDGFSGKRPFGSSGWRSDLVIPLAKAGYVAGREVSEPEDEWEEWEGLDYERGFALIHRAIEALK